MGRKPGGFEPAAVTLRAPMQTWIPLWLPGETDHASAVDLLFTGLLVSSCLVLLLLFFLMLFTFMASVLR